jgi:hypothetical protein
MSKLKNVTAIAMAIIVALSITACASEVGSTRWCEQMKAKPKGDWTAKEAGNFAKHCIFKKR